MVPCKELQGMFWEAFVVCGKDVNYIYMSYVYIYIYIDISEIVLLWG